jgi:hypothetical protein
MEFFRSQVGVEDSGVAEKKAVIAYHIPLVAYLCSTGNDIITIPY